MHPKLLQQLLESVQTGKASIEEAMRRLETLPFEVTDAASIDHHRALRCGFPEVLYCEGKTEAQVADIFNRLARGGSNVLATRASPEQFSAVTQNVPKAEYHEAGRCITLRVAPPRLSGGTIALAAAGTTDLPVLEEARVTCEIMDQRTQVIRDVGIAGVHRLLSQSEVLRSARVIVAVAGMDGALPGVISGLVKAPVIAVPTSVGYGASFAGIAPLLTMLNACAPGVAVMNIDNGFGAGYMASMINRIGDPD